jgi:hypothetical protein
MRRAAPSAPAALMREAGVEGNGLSDDPEQNDDQDNQQDEADDSAWKHYRLLSR